MTKEDLQQIAELLQPIHEELAEIRTDVRHTRMLIEKQEHNVQLIAEQYTDIAEKLDKANDRAAQLDDMRTRLRTLEAVVMNHTAAIRELRKAE